LGQAVSWETHGVPKVWPNGPPKPAKNGRDPGGHNRNAQIWNMRGGHYGHSNVPVNTHWDPAYTADEVTFLIAFDPSAESVEDIDISERFPSIPETDPELATDESRMPDHHHVEEPPARPRPSDRPIGGPLRPVAPVGVDSSLVVMAAAVGLIAAGLCLLWSVERSRTKGRRA